MTLTRARLSLLAAMVVATTAPLAAQVVRVTVPEENFRKEPAASSSNRLATVLEGTTLAVRERQGRWVLGELEGWIWAASVQTTDRDGFSLIVSKTGGENLRREPDVDAPRSAILMQGMLLDSLGAEGDWRRVRRAAWIWSASTAETEDAARPPEVAAAPTPATPAAADRIVVGSTSAGLLVSPDGDTAAVVDSGTDLEVLAREGGWTRVRLEGWVWEAATLPPDSATGEFSVADLRANPEQFRGRRVEWTVRFVALQRAEAIRTDFYEGEPYFLANPPSRSRDLVYVAVPPELLPAVEELAALQTVDIVGRVRTGRSQTGVPILDLIAFR
jgi:membrane protein implicated in regulation of membrane protease activity